MPAQKIKIATDSLSDLTPELYQQYQIAVFPLCIVLDDEEYFDGENITVEKMFAFVEKTKRLPKTAARSIDDFLEFYSELAKDGSDVVFVSLSSGISVNYENSLKAANDFNEKAGRKQIHSVDGMVLSSATGLLAIKAAELRDEGKSAAEIADYIKEAAPKVQASFVIDTTEYLHKGGRCSGIASFSATVLRIKPTIRLSNGKMGVGKKYMGTLKKNIRKYVNDTFDVYPEYDDSRIMITHCFADPECIESARKTILERANFKEILVTEAGCGISTHCGKGTIGILFIGK